MFVINVTFSHLDKYWLIVVANFCQESMDVYKFYIKRVLSTLEQWARNQCYPIAGRNCMTFHTLKEQLIIDGQMRVSLSNYFNISTLVSGTTVEPVQSAP